MVARPLLGALALSLVACGGSAPGTPVRLVYSVEPTPDLTTHAAATVRLRVDDGRASYLRSGVFVDPRGYVLTSFAAVGVQSTGGGRHGEGGGRVGTLFNADEVHVEVFSGPYETVPTEYVAKVVRGDVRLNLALLRVTRTLDQSLPPDHRFAAVTLLDQPHQPQWGGTGFAIGAAANIPSLVVSHAYLYAGITNSLGEVAGYLVSGTRGTMEGAPYFDGEGAFAGVLSRGFLRPAHRVPSGWREELRGEGIDDRRVDGVERLEPGRWAEVDRIGDSVYVPPMDESSVEPIEEFLFELPDDTAGTVITEPAVPMSAYQAGRPLASATGELFVTSERDVVVAVRMPRPDDPRGLRLRVRFEPLR